MADKIKVNDKVDTSKKNAIENLNALDLLKSAGSKVNSSDKTPQDHADSSGVACALGLCWELRPDRQ
ncbi:MAG TPA: hypothetical protein V6C97_10185 [Oculatellaceae cyanobacterium]